ncbi:PQQ-dependent sugar dehydrogenase [Lutibaculum baratangense]|uniref:PQQ-dependent oxidoreductase, gdhB family n=1 Tax=Lutibaculum baratangense AMV1 TaxID=631454 RepID=V4RS83_9HYPH|nr:PQQ-dependent sugar dehydrogenase [Lutibaculum baratangense]ESR25985.1 PQQ-dependent oxidoreductase, gdhB family [Lutibaculum baratangense AMV1]
MAHFITPAAIGLLLGLLVPLPAADAAAAEGPAREAPAAAIAAGAVERVAGPFDFPWSIAFLPEGGMLVGTRPGRLWRVSADGERREIAGVPEVLTGNHAGLLDVMVTRDFARSGTVYLAHVRGEEPANTVILSRARLQGDELIDREEIFVAEPMADGLDEFGGRLAEGADGHVFLSLGFKFDPERSQDLGQHWGKILRLDPDGEAPFDNPFAHVPGARREIWSFGHRNPQGLAFHPVTGELWSHEHGPQGGDEVNRIEPGRNYGWPVVTHGINYDGTPVGIGVQAPGMADPLHVWTPSIAPSGLAIDAEGTFWAGALAGMTLVRLEPDGEGGFAETRMLEGEFGRIRDVRRGPDGDLWFVTDDPEGHLYRVPKAAME